MDNHDNTIKPDIPPTDLDASDAQPNETTEPQDQYKAEETEAVADGGGDTAPPLEIPKEAHDPDAAIGNKTSKSGKVERFYGYHEHTLLQTPHGKEPNDTEPRLISRFELTPANEDIVETTLSLIDRATRKATDISVDRHYHYKKPERWWDELHIRGIGQHHDLREDEQGFTEIDHTRWAAGWPHCPATPDDLGDIVRPGPGADPKTKETFRERIARRYAFAMRRVTSPALDGTARWECPAVAGKLGCPLRAGTLQAAMDLGLPIVENPPNPTSPDAPRCCTQRTVQVTPDAMRRKLMQPHYWGSADWEHEYNKRPYVEGSYGNRKNPSTENLRRGHFRLTGLALVHIATAMAASAYNLRMLRNWNDRTAARPDDHPLLDLGQPDYGFVRLTKEEADELAAQQLENEEPDADDAAA